VEENTPAAAYANLKLPKLGYNATLCNLYRNGNDSVGLHADAEPEMGPVISSVSLGADKTTGQQHSRWPAPEFEAHFSGSLEPKRSYNDWPCALACK
jgi:alkylated DNA repair dioxygenase AlkB